MTAANQPNPLPPAPSQGWRAYFAEKAYGIGQGAITLATGAKDIVVRKGGALLSSAGAKTAGVGAALYQRVPGGQKAAPLASRLLAATLPSLATLQKRIDHLHTDLKEIADSQVPGELSKATAVYARSYVQHCITNAESIDPTIAPQWVQDTFLHKSAGDVVNSGFLGDTAKALIRKNPAVLEKIVELNLAKGLCNVFQFIKDKQTNEPNWLVHFAKEFCDSITKELDGQANGKEMSEEESGELFVRAFSNKILEIAFPNGAKDLELHSASLAPFKTKLFSLVKEQILPYALHNLYRDATSTYTRDYVVNQAVKYLKNFFETGSLGKLQDATLPEQQGARAPALKPDEQEAFGESLVKGSKAMLQALDKDLAKIAADNKIGALLKASAPTIIESIQNINHLEAVSGIVKSAMPLIFPGGQQTSPETASDKDYTFAITQPMVFAKTRAEVEQEKKPYLAKQRKLVKETETIMKTITSNLKGLFGAIATAFVGKIKENPEGFREKCNNFFKKIGHAIVYTVVRFYFYTGYTDVLKSTLTQAHSYARDLSIGKVGAPARRVMTHNIAPPKAR